MRPANPREALEQLVAGTISVPVSEMPRMEESRVTGWHPATASQADGSQWMIAFTTQELASQFCASNPEFGYFITVDTKWALHALPDGHGIVFDLGVESMFSWNAPGIAKYKKDILGWQ